MSIIAVKATACCDRCGNTWVVLTEKLLDVRKKLRNTGWDVTGTNDYCPNCLPKRAKPEGPQL